jgi:hypothetical protein
MIELINPHYLEQAMVQKHLECDELFNTLKSTRSNRMFLGSGCYGIAQYVFFTILAPIL